MEKQTFILKLTGDTLSASEWNDLTEYVNTLVDEVNEGGSLPSAIDPNGVIEVNSKGNTTISSAKHVNIEPLYDPTGSEQGSYGDLLIKPGDDITLESHHRSTDKRDEITVKTSNGQSGALKAPVKLQIIANDITLSSKGKKGDNKSVMNINVTDGEGKGYLKVRARAIDLRCEEHGGIAIQPKGLDTLGNMNKIKFEHGGGDGLEFATFNTEKTSIFTDEYRFNREGIWKMATRNKYVSDKYDGVDETTHYKYTKQEDDFYDVVDLNDAQCKTKDIIKTAYAMNGTPCIHTKITNGGNLEISTSIQFLFEKSDEASDVFNEFILMESPYASFESGKYYSLNDVISPISEATNQGSRYVSGENIGNVDMDWVRSQFNSFLNDQESITLRFSDTKYYTFTKFDSPNIKIDSGAELKLGGTLDFGSTFNFGETDNGIEVQYKLTKKNATKDCGIIKVVGYNNSTSQDLTVEGVTIPAKSSSESNANVATIAQCSILDIIKLVNYMKTNNEGPWAELI